MEKSGPDIQPMLIGKNDPKPIENQFQATAKRIFTIFNFMSLIDEIFRLVHMNALKGKNVPVEEQVGILDLYLSNNIEEVIFSRQCFDVLILI